MKELEPYGDLDKLVFDVAEKKIAEAKIRLANAPQDCDLTKFKKDVEEVNKWVDFVCPTDDDNLYDEYRQRLFITNDGKMVTFGGEEVDVDVRKKRRKK